MSLKTSIYDAHLRAGGKMVSYAEYYLPIHYESGIVKEHMAVREKVGIFDISHMGEIRITGKDSLENIQYFVTNDCSVLENGTIRYSTMCKEDGTIVDDLLIYKLGEEEYLCVVNAVNKDRVYNFMIKHSFADVLIQDKSKEIALIALQGRFSKDILKKLMKEEDIPQKYYTFRDKITIAGITCLLSRTGYTGELGYELYCKYEDGEKLWNTILMAGEEYGIVPCGLGARDTLRLEAGMPLYGHEMSDKITPYDTGLDFVVKANKEKFLGKEALASHKRNKTRVGIRIIGRGIARESCEIFYNDEQIGITTSGTHCPYLGYPVAMGIIDKEYQDIGRKVELMIRGRRVEGVIVPLPFYNLNKK